LRFRFRFLATAYLLAAVPAARDNKHLPVPLFLERIALRPERADFLRSFLAGAFRKYEKPIGRARL
jgi:hypothetical protein